MIEPWLNGLVVGMFGFLTGAVLALFGIVQEARQRLEASRKPGWSFDEIIERSRQEAQAAWKLMPRSGKATLVAFYGLIGAMILIIKFSPLTMNWWPYLGALFAGFLIVQRIYQSARAGATRAAAE
jgi:hypothetical protein